MKKEYKYKVINQRTEYLVVMAETEEEANKKLLDFNISAFLDSEAEDNYLIDEAELESVD